MMFRFIKSKITMKQVVIVSISIPIFMAAQQGIELRQKYNKRQRLHLPPTNSGIEKWKTKIINFKDGIRERFTQAQQQAHDDDEKTIINNIRFVLKDIQTKVKSRIGIDNHESNTDGKLNKIKSWMENILKKKSFVKLESGVTSSSPSSSSNKMKGDNKMNPVPSSSSGSPLSQKKIKLLIIGDSLVSGVGCTNAEAPTLVKTIAQTLSATLGVDIEWKSAGVVGGTTSDIRMQLLPALKRDFLAVKEEDKLNTEIIAIVICGLNDWKSMLEQFPFGAGPARFRQELKDLLNELQTDIDVPCRVFIPAYVYNFI